MMLKKSVVRFCFLIVVLFTFTSFQVNATTNQDDCTLIDAKHYYYKQLNEIEKSIYDSLTNSKEKLINGEEIVFPIHPYDENNKKDYLYYFKLIKRVVRAFTYDNPEVLIWFNNYDRIFMHDQFYVYMTLRPKASVTINSEKIMSELTKLETQSLNFVNSLSGTDVEKLQQIHNYLIQSKYDYTYSYPNIDNPYGAIIAKNCICSGFASAYKYLADLANLNVIYVTGKFYDSTSNEYIPHAWNIVYTNNQYFLVDVCIDATSSNNKNNFSLTSISNNTHYIDSYYFNYQDFK